MVATTTASTDFMQQTRILQHEVEMLVKKKHGGSYLKEKKGKKELARVNSELRQLKSRISALEILKSILMEQK